MTAFMVKYFIFGNKTATENKSDLIFIPYLNIEKCW